MQFPSSAYSGYSKPEDVLRQLLLIAEKRYGERVHEVDFIDSTLAMERLYNMKKIIGLLAFIFLLFITSLRAYDHVFIIMLENAGFDAIVGDTADAPYINNELIPQGTLYTQHYGVTHPSEPNYLALFSGSTQGVTTNKCIGTNGPFLGDNLYSRLTRSNFSCLGYMESMPLDGYLGCKSGLYVQKHNPFPFFSYPGRVPVSAWVVYSGPYSDSHSWPNLAWITPNLVDDMHKGATLAEKISNGDSWLSVHLPPIISYCDNNNGLIILTMDEGPHNHIFTLLIGSGIEAGGINGIMFNHYNTLRTITDNFGVKAFVNVPPLF